MDPEIPPGPLQGTIPEGAAKDVVADKPPIPAGAEALAAPIPTEAIDATAEGFAAVAPDLPRGAIVFESLQSTAQPSAATSPQAATGLHEHTTADSRLRILQAQYEAERQRANTLARVDEQRTVFFSDVSHECRTPLTLILGPASDLLAGAHGELSQEQREQIRLIHQNGIQLLKLVNTLFTFLRIESGVDEAMWQLPDDEAWLPELAPPAPEADASPQSAGSGEDRLDEPEGRILIAEDHAGLRSYLNRLLGRRWRTEVVSDGHAALEAARARRPDLIIADAMMPGLDGVALVREVRADDRTSTIPVLLLSGRAGEEARVDGLLAGAADYLVKPFSDRELTAKVQSHLALSRAQRKNEEQIASRDAFYAAASHELRNPIHSLQLQVLAILRGLDGEERTPRLEWVRRRVDKAHDQLLRVIRLLDRLLDLSRISSGRVPLELEDVDLAGVVQSVVDRLDPAEQAHIACVLQPTTGHWDRVGLEQVVANLVSNALKYGEGQPVEIVVRRREEGGARLAVTDRGIGVAVTDQDRIFQRFERAVADGHYSGLGLGLWIASRIVEELGGTMSLQSTPGEGSTFIVDLPARSPQAERRRGI